MADGWAMMKQFDQAQSPDMRKVVQVAIVSVAVEVQMEDVSTVNHADRSRLANAVANNSAAYAERFAMVVVTSKEFQSAGFADDAVLSAVRRLWSAVAIGA